MIALAASVGIGCRSSAQSATAVDSARSLPSIAVVALDGTATDLRSVLHGRVALISLWATWCDVCVSEIDALARLQEQAAARNDAVVIGVAVGETREAIASFAQKHPLRYSQVVDQDFRLVDALGEPRVPTTLVIDRGGRIVFRGGALDSGALAAFRGALGGGP